MKLIGAAVVISTAMMLAAPSNATLGAPSNMKAKASAPGDTLNYRLTWGAARGATGYRVVVRELWNPPGTYTGLPANDIVTPNSVLFSAISLAADSAQFRAVVWSRQNNREHPDSSFVVWSVRRLGPPGPIVVDSSLVIEDVVIFPRDLVLALAAEEVRVQPFCTIGLFYGGAAAYQGLNAASICDSVARSVGTLPTHAQRFTMDTSCFSFELQREDGTPAPFFIDHDACSSNARVWFTL